MKKLLVLTAVAVFLLLGTQVRADIVYEDPGDLQINGTTAFLFGTDVHALTDPFSIAFAGNSGATLSDVFLILAVPGEGEADPAAFAGASGGSNLGDLTSGKDVYHDILNFGAGSDGSESFANFTLHADQTATNFDIWRYDLHTSLTNGGSISVDITTAPPVGTYAMAYGFGNDGKVYVVPFTNAGLEGPPSVPEPSALMLLGSGLLGLAFFGRKKINS